MYLAVVGHCPCIGCGEGDNLVGHVIEISVDGKRKVIHERCRHNAPCHTYIIFIGLLGTQLAIAEAIVVEVVERGGCGTCSCTLP